MQLKEKLLPWYVLPEPILTRRLTWKVSINLFIRFGMQSALSFEVSASLKTSFCLFMFFFWLEKFMADFSQALGKNCQKPLAGYINTYICLNLLVCCCFLVLVFVLFCFFRRKLMIFAFSKTLCGLRVWGFPNNFYSHKIYISPSLICKLICC